MRVQIDDVSQARKRLSIEVPPEEVASVYDRALRQARRSARVPGFRPGKAPIELVRKRLGEELGGSVAETLVETCVPRAIREKELDPVPGGVFLDLGEDRKDPPPAEEGQAYSFEILVDVMPEVELPEYTGLEIARPKAEVQPEEIEAELDGIRQSLARLEPVPLRPSEKGDYVEMEIEGAEIGGDARVERKTQVIRLGEGSNLPEFDKALVGLRPGAEFAFDVAYPEEFPSEPLRGRTIHFSGEVKEVKEKQVPELSDEIAEKVADVATVAELREKVRELVQRRKNAEADAAARRRLLDVLLDRTPFEAPPSLVEKELEHRLDAIGRNLAMQGVDPAKAEIDWDKVISDERQNAARAVREEHLLDLIADREGLTADDEEVNHAVSHIAEEAGRKPTEVRSELAKRGALKSLKQQVLRRKCLDWLYEKTHIV